MDINIEDNNHSNQTDNKNLQAPIRYFSDGTEKLAYNPTEFLVSLRKFAFLRENRYLSRSEVLRAYDRYKYLYVSRQISYFFSTNKSNEIFKLLYNTDNIISKSLNRLVLCKKKVEFFIAKLNSKNSIPYINYKTGPALEPVEDLDFLLIQDKTEFYKNRILIDRIPFSAFSSSGFLKKLTETFSTIPGTGEISIPESNYPGKPIHPKSDIISTLSKIISDETPSYRFTVRAKGLIRGCVSYKSEESCKLALTKFQSYPIAYSTSEDNKSDANSDDSKYFLLLSPYPFPYPPSNKYITIPNFTVLLPERLMTDIRQAINLIKTLDCEKGISQNPIFDSEIGKKFYDGLDNISKMNLLLYYLRFVHLFCYYCCIDYETEEQLVEHCGYFHIRSDELGADNKPIIDDMWAGRLDSKIARRLLTPYQHDQLSKEEKNTIDLALKKFYSDNAETISEEKTKCKICSKMFQNNEYCVKHIEKKHSAEIKNEINCAKESQDYKNYLKDLDPILPTVIYNPPSSSRYQNERSKRKMPVAPIDYRPVKKYTDL